MYLSPISLTGKTQQAFATAVPLLDFLDTAKDELRLLSKRCARRAAHLASKAEREESAFRAHVQGMAAVRRCRLSSG